VAICAHTDRLLQLTDYDHRFLLSEFLERQALSPIMANHWAKFLIKKDCGQINWIFNQIEKLCEFLKMLSKTFHLLLKIKPSRAEWYAISGRIISTQQSLNLATLSQCGYSQPWTYGNTASISQSCPDWFYDLDLC
jgi:hypothetical protein